MSTPESLNVAVLDLDDRGLSSLIESLSAQLDLDFDSDSPFDFNERGNKLKYSKMVTELLVDPFSVEQHLAYGFSKSEIWARSQVVYQLLEEWLMHIGYTYGVDTLLDVKLIDYRLFIIGVKDVRKKFQDNRMGKRYTRYNRTSQNKCAVGL